MKKRLSILKVLSLVSTVTLSACVVNSGQSNYVPPTKSQKAANMVSQLSPVFGSPPWNVNYQGPSKYSKYAENYIHALGSRPSVFRDADFVLQITAQASKAHTCSRGLSVGASLYLANRGRDLLAANSSNFCHDDVLNDPDWALSLVLYNLYRRSGNNPWTN